jgi:hypothetical protein
MTKAREFAESNYTEFQIGNEDMTSVIRAMIRSYEAGFDVANAWIPVSERLPDDNGEYWVTRILRSGSITCIRLFIVGDEDSKVQWQTCYAAWMPLNKPEPYNPEETK